MRPQNLLFILSDQHNAQFLGSAGHSVVRTPNLDRLAQSGTRFTRTTTPCPICVPARASLATGRWVHQIRCWDNAQPYDGTPASWGHHLLAQGHEVAAVGKLHYRSDADANGFGEKINIMNVLDGVGDRLGLLRHLDHERGAARQLAESAASGESTYTHYDREVATAACDWLARRGTSRSDKPWVLFVGFVMPHLPLVSPDEFFAMYASEGLPEPRLYSEEARPHHPWLDRLTRVIPYDKYFDAERRRTAMIAYHGMVTFLDHNIGLLLRALADNGLEGSTRVLYTSDHGEMLGNHGIWGKCCMYEESVSVPLMLSGADVPAGALIGTETSLVDCFPTIIDAVGAKLSDADRADLPGHSLLRQLGATDETRVGFSEYHAVGAPSGCFMVRRGRWKLVHYVGFPPQLFDLAADPIEANDLGERPEWASVRDNLFAELRRIVDPEAASAQAFADQQAKVRQFGGEGAILEIGDFGHTPTPNETPHFERVPDSSEG